MKKLICLLLTVSLVSVLAACGGSSSASSSGEAAEETSETSAQSAPSEEPAADAQWTRDGYFQDENENMLSVTWMDDIDEPGWYVGVMLGEDMVEDSYGGTLQPEGSTLSGTLLSSGSQADLSVTLSEEGEDGLLLEVKDGETYHFVPMDMPDASIFVTIDTEGLGNIEYTEGETAPEIDTEYPYQSAQINLGEAATYTFLAWPSAGSLFVKWTKNGEDFSTDPQITVLLDESADFVAVFEDDPNWQNPVMNFIGEYQCDRAHAVIECFGNEEAMITIDWGGSASETARWTIIGKLDTETLTIEYTDATKSILTFDSSGEIESEEEEYIDGTGTITFAANGSFTWHDDRSEYEEDMVFEWAPPEAE